MLKTRLGRRSWLLGNAAGLGTLIRTGRQIFAAQDAATQNGLPALLPWPQSVKFGARSFPLAAGGAGSTSIVVDEATGEAGSKAAAIIAEEIQRRTHHAVKILKSPGAAGFEIRISGFRGLGEEKESKTEGGYRLDVTPQGAHIQATNIGLAYAVATFNQLMTGWEKLEVREAEIHDWPDFPWRGIFMEVSAVAGMSLADWKEFIPYAASLKLNAINVGLYNCWQRSPALELDAEFFLFPSHKYPEFRTTYRSVRYSRDGQTEIRQDLPAIYTEDFLGEVMAFGKEHGIEVSPYLTSLSHNTLIPRLMPEISMKDANCKPIGYGFCTTCPKTYEVLFNLYDEIINRYMQPNGITTFNVGMDELTTVCQCPDCREAWNGVDNFYLRHLVKITKYLQGRGMKRILMWHDMLHRSGLINRQLESLLAAEGIEDLITIGWWTYSKPAYADSLGAHDSFGKAFFRPATKIENWAVPSAGWDVVEPLAASMHSQNEALLKLLLLARERKAQGTLSYSIHDPMFDQGYINFSQYSWNQTPTLQETWQRYSCRLLGPNDDRLTRWLGLYRKAYESYSEIVSSFYNRGTPRLVGSAIATLPAAASRESSFASAIGDLETAWRGLRDIRGQIQDPGKLQVIEIYQVEVRRLQTFLQAAHATLKCNTAYDQFRDQRDSSSLLHFAAVAGELTQALQGYSQFLEELQQVRYPASRPRFMVYEVRALSNFRKIAQVYAELVERARKGDADFLPEVVVAQDNFFAVELGMVLPSVTQDLKIRL